MRPTSSLSSARELSKNCIFATYARLTATRHQSTVPSAIDASTTLTTIASGSTTVSAHSTTQSSSCSSPQLSSTLHFTFAAQRMHSLFISVTMRRIVEISQSTMKLT